MHYATRGRTRVDACRIRRYRVIASTPDSRHDGTTIKPTQAMSQPTSAPRAEPTFPPDPQLHSVLGWGFLLVGMVISLFMCVTLFDKYAAWDWPKAQAQITSSTLYKSTGRSTRWCIQLRYRYTVGGREFTGRRQATSWLSNVSCDRSHAVMQARFAHQQPGDPITVRYRPGQPGRVVVYADGISPAEWFFVALAIALVAGGIGTLRAAARLRREALAHAAERAARMQHAAALQGIRLYSGGTTRPIRLA